MYVFFFFCTSGTCMLRSSPPAAESFPLLEYNVSQTLLLPASVVFALSLSLCCRLLGVVPRAGADGRRRLERQAGGRAGRLGPCSGGEGAAHGVFVFVLGSQRPRPTGRQARRREGGREREREREETEAICMYNILGREVVYVEVPR